MSKTSWRDKSKSRFKKPTESFFGFAEEETTFDAQSILESTPDLNTTVPPAFVSTQPSVQEASAMSRVQNWVTPKKESDSTIKAPTLIPFLQSETDSKEITNGYQTDNSRSYKQVANGQQTDNKQTTSIPVGLPSKPETDNKQVTKRVTEQITIEQQTDNKRITISGFEALVGNEKNLLLLIFKECLRVGSLTSPEITLSYISEAIEINPGVAKMVIHRLVKKRLIERAASKTGRGGWIKFSIQKDLYQDLRIRESDNKEITNGYQTDNKQVTKRVTEQITSVPYSSSNDFKDLKNTTTIAVPENLKRFGISAVNLQSLVTSGKAQLEVVERSLSALSFDVENGKTGSLANILFGVLNAGREYVSQKYSENLQSELNQELARIIEAEENQKRVVETKLAAKFKQYLASNPSFLDSVQERHKGLVEDPFILEKVAFEEFKKDENASR